MGRWTPSLHPRDRNGRFTKKTSVGIRVSTRSVSATAGVRFPIVPGKVNLFVGGLVRIENASRAKGPLDRLADAGRDKLINALPEGAISRIGKGLIGEGQYRSGSTLIQGTTGRRSTPTIRVGRTSGSGKTRTPARNGKPASVQTTTGSGTRSPNRKPRQPRAPRPRRVA